MVRKAKSPLRRVITVAWDRRDTFRPSPMHGIRSFGMWLIRRRADARWQLLQRTTSRHRIFISLLHFTIRSAILIPLQGGLTVMGIESLNSAVAAAGFAMVSEEGMDVGEIMGRSAIEEVSEQTWAAPSSSRAIALLEGPARSHGAASQSLGERVTGFLDALRPKG